MEETTTISVFLSYSSEDNVCAKRVYDDLCRSGLDIWGYEKNGRIGVNFIEEFSNQLMARQYFCLLDSEKARNSEYVRKECSIARKLIVQNSSFTAVPCLIQSRDQEHSWWSEELFENQNEITYIDLTDYEKGIRRLCGQLGAIYFPDSQIPRDQDFQAELFTAGLNLDQATELSELYSKFRQDYTRRPDIARNWLVNLIERLEDLDAKTIVSPRIALGVMEAEADRHKEAKAAFQRFAELHPTDPRAWMGLGSARYYCCDYQGALTALRYCKKIIMNKRHPTYTAHLPKVAHNIARIFLVMGKPERARIELDKIPDEVKSEANLKALQGKILLELQSPYDAVLHLEDSLQSFDSLQQTPPSSLLIDLADCYRVLHRETDEKNIIERGLNVLNDDPEIFRRMADISVYGHKFEKAIYFLEKVITKVPDSVVYRAELSSILFYTGKIEEARREAKKCVRLEDDLEIKTARDNYFLGLAYYILNKLEIAEHMIGKARRRDSVIAGWPVYEQLF